MHSFILFSLLLGFDRFAQLYRVSCLLLFLLPRHSWKLWMWRVLRRTDCGIVGRVFVTLVLIQVAFSQGSLTRRPEAKQNKTHNLTLLPCRRPLFTAMAKPPLPVLPNVFEASLLLVWWFRRFDIASFPIFFFIYGLVKNNKRTDLILAQLNTFFRLSLRFSKRPNSSCHHIG